MIIPEFPVVLDVVTFTSDGVYSPNTSNPIGIQIDDKALFEHYESFKRFEKG